MGFKNKKKIDFVPLELSESNVQVIYNRCITTYFDSNETTKRILFSETFGYEKNAIPKAFHRNKLIQSKFIIRYLYGQLLDIHNNYNTVHRLSIQSATKIYTDKIWTTNPEVLMQFLYLGSASNILGPFESEKNNAALINSTLKPTLSPNDPHFSDWWEQHKSEWETPNE